MDMIDISMVISPEMPTYKGITERKPIIEVTNTIDQGSNESRLSILHHTGTHVDAPFHMLSQGKTIDLYPLQHFEGKAIVLELSNLEKASGVTTATPNFTESNIESLLFWKRQL